MDLEEILNIIKEDFPDKSIDISESLGLLMGTIDDVMNGINNKIGQAYLNRDFKAAEKYMNLGKNINFYENRIDEIINITSIDQNEINALCYVLYSKILKQKKHKISLIKIQYF